jgi:hypothetical protein
MVALRGPPRRQKDGGRNSKKIQRRTHSMIRKPVVAALAVVGFAATSALAQTEIHFWHPCPERWATR